MLDLDAIESSAKYARDHCDKSCAYCFMVKDRGSLDPQMVLDMVKVCRAALESNLGTAIDLIVHHA